MPRELSRQQMLTIFELWGGGASRQQIADAVGFSIHCLEEHRARGQLKGLLPKRRGCGSKSGGIPDNPTPEQLAEVEARKLEVQSRWTPQQKLERTVNQSNSVHRVADIMAAYRMAMREVPE